MTARARRSLGVAGVAALILAACSLSPRWDGPVSDHFDGERFYGPESFDKSIGDLWRFYREKPPSQWERNLERPPGPRPVERVGPGELRATLVNHATVLLQFDGINLLTDPIWSLRAGPGGLVGAKRFFPPGIRFEDLPEIDVVLISHNHYDHLDFETLERLQAHSAPMFVVPPGDGVWLRERGLQRIVELDWGEAAALPNGCRVHAQPAQHWSQRRILPSDRNYSLWLAFVLETAQGPVYFAGDTGYGPHFAHIATTFGPMRLALLPIGAYDPRWLMTYQHVDPTEAVQAHRDLQALTGLGIHWGTFELAAEGPMQPVDDLAAARVAAGLEPAHFFAPAHGRAISLPPVEGPRTRCTPKPSTS